MTAILRHLKTTQAYGKRSEDRQNLRTGLAPHTSLRSAGIAMSRHGRIRGMPSNTIRKETAGATKRANELKGQLMTNS